MSSEKSNNDPETNKTNDNIDHENNINDNENNVTNINTLESQSNALSYNSDSLLINSNLRKISTTSSSLSLTGTLEPDENDPLYLEEDTYGDEDRGQENGHEHENEHEHEDNGLSDNNEDNHDTDDLLDDKAFDKLTNNLDLDLDIDLHTEDGLDHSNIKFDNQDMDDILKSSNMNDLDLSSRVLHSIMNQNSNNNNNVDLEKEEGERMSPLNSELDMLQKRVSEQLAKNYWIWGRGNFPKKKIRKKQSNFLKSGNFPNTSFEFWQFW